MMKMYTRLFSLIVMLIVLNNQRTEAQVFYTATVSGEVTNVNNWDDGSGGHPADFTSGDYFYIPAGINMTHSSGVWALNDLLGTGGLGLEIDNGASLTVSGTANVTFPTSLTHTFNLNGSYTHNSTAQISRTLIDEATTYNNNLNAGSTFTIGSNQSYNVAQLPNNVKFGTLVLSSGVTATIIRRITLNGSLALNTGSVLIMSNGPLVGAGVADAGFTGQTGTGTLRTSNATSPPFPASKTWAGTVELNRTSAQFIPAGTYNNLNATGGDRTLNTGIISISGTLTVGSGTYTVNSSNTVTFNGTSTQNIPALGTSNYNNLTISNGGRKSLTSNVSVDGVLTVTNATGILAINGNTLTVNGSLSIAGSLAGSSTSNLVIGGTAGGSAGSLRLNAAAGDSSLATFTVNRTGAGATVTLGTNISIIGSLSVTNGTLDLNGKIITLKSTSNANTARVSAVTGTITHNGGVFAIERFIPAGFRAFRDLSTGGIAPSDNIFNTWQEAGATPSGFGTHVTGIAGMSGGFDATTGLDYSGSGAKSMYTNTNGTWTTIDNTKTTTLDPARAYRITIRGDRNFNLYTSPQPTSMNTATTLRSYGTLVNGTINYSTSGITGAITSSFGLTNTVGNYSFLGNPYANAIDWSLITKSNLATTYTYLDPTMGTSGAYVTVDGSGTVSNPSSNATQFIQPGQGFFVQTTAASPTLTIQETNKATSSTATNIFRTQSMSRLKIGISKFIATSNANITMDGTVLVVATGENNNVDFDDAEKFTNSTENIAIYRAGKRISIERRASVTNTDTLPLRIWTVNNGTNYTLTFDTKEFNTNNDVVLIDKYANTERILKLNDTSKISFYANTGDSNTYINRFYVVFRTNSALPLSNISLSATAKNNGAEIVWTTTNEVAMSSYELEESTDGINFNLLGSKKANNQITNQYIVFDPNTVKGANYYRVKMIGQNGETKYSKTVLLNLGKQMMDVLSVYPNPIKGSQVSVQLNDIVNGKYVLVLYNQIGQQILTKSFDKNGTGITTIQLDWSDKSLATGNYTLVLLEETSKNKIATKGMVIQ